MSEQMTFLDFFSGIGGFRAGLELCGMKCKGHCEIDKYANRSYAAFFDIKEDEWYGEDITKVKPEELPRVNIWTGGFPCQDISAVRRLGLEDAAAVCFLRLLDCSKAQHPKIDPNGLSLKMLKTSYPFTEDGTLRPFSIRWPKSAIVSNTDFLIQNSTAFRKTESEFTLSLTDILEPETDEKYFLSSAATARLLSGS